MKLLTGTTDRQTEELLFYGASVVFSSVKIFDEAIDEIRLLRVMENCGCRRITSSDYGYIEKILNRAGQNASLQYDTTVVDSLSPIQLDDDTQVTPLIRHHVFLFAQKAVLLQSILIFDYRKITHTHCDTTDISRTLSVTDLLRIIHEIKNGSGESGRAFKRGVERIFADISDKARMPYSQGTDTLFFNEQNIAIQIWDIASLPADCDKDNISGDYLEDRYELDLAALLLLYNENYTQGDIWKDLSRSQIQKALDKKTDVLKDHRILISERICVEISQVDAPTLRTVSAMRLQLYGYDSTSVFLWGLISIVESGYKDCCYELDALYRREVSNGKSGVPIADFSRTRQKILAEKDSYEFLDKMCIEDRHKAFLGNASGKKGLADYLNRIADTDKQIQDLADLIILERTSDANEEIKKLLETLQNYTKEQDRSNDIISWLSLLLAISSVFSVAEYITGVFLIESLLGKVITLAAIICVFAVVAVIIIKTRR